MNAIILYYWGSILTSQLVTGNININWLNHAMFKGKDLKCLVSWKKGSFQSKTNRYNNNSRFEDAKYRYFLLQYWILFIRELLINIDLREHMIWVIDIKFSIKLRKETTYFSIYATYKNYTTFNQNPSHIFNQTMNKCSRGYNLENIKCSIKPE